MFCLVLQRKPLSREEGVPQGEELPPPSSAPRFGRLPVLGLAHPTPDSSFFHFFFHKINLT